MASNRYFGFMVDPAAGDFIRTSAPTKSAPLKAHYLDATSEDISTDKGFIYPTTSAQRLKRNRLLGPVTVGGEIQVPLYSVGTPTMIYYAMGACKAETAAVSGVYTHEISVGEDVPTFFAFIGKDHREHQFSGGVVKSMTIDFETSEPALASFDCMFSREIYTSSAVGGAVDDTVSFPDYNVAERAWAGAEIDAKIAASASETAVAVNYIESASLELTNTAVEDNYALGNRYIPAKFIQEAEVTGNMSMNFANIARYEDFITEKEPKLELAGESRGTGGTLRKFEFIMHKVSFNTGNLPTEGSDRYVFETEYMCERIPDAVSTNPDNYLTYKVSNREPRATLVG